MDETHALTDQNTLLLYGTDHCHLCDRAESLVAEALADERYSWVYEKVDISDSEPLFERYGWLIPVLATPAGAELRWPFDASTLEAFLLNSQP